MNHPNFFENAKLADAVEIDSTYFVRWFHVEQGDDEEFEPYCSTEMVDDDYNKHEWHFDKEDMDEAYWNEDKQAWVIGNHTIKFFKISQVSPCNTLQV